ncbi:DUF4179 domain-containing protein [Psychrobacillus glaciei]|uniref:DUF4179 domain-containing protein n=1 Tax=Psychrobacillus glaciei TaxID=2283160 RepID=A0A5J6SIP7_9BACI|nr:DUF4179 domain-containing protein [Psychrobacillus glaciei]QFF97721.1 DUF4179 domain-containing protein [Psychrobacillus glaciei]
MFEEEEKKLEQRKKTIDKVEVPMDKLHFAVRNGFEKAKKERILKRKKIIKRSTWSFVVAAILLISFITSINVSPAFANKVASIPGLDRIVALIQQDKGLVAAIENDFYQPINKSQEKNGITVTLDGVIADKKGMIIFYSVKTEEVDVNSLGLKYLALWSKNYGEGERWEFIKSAPPLTPNQDSHFNSGTMHIEKVTHKKDLSWKIGLQIGEKIENFKIPFTYKTMDVESKDIIVNKEVTVYGQHFKVMDLIVDPIRTVVRIEEDPSNTKKLLACPFDELELVDELGRKWSTLPCNAYKPLEKGNVWEVPLKESFYFYDPKKLTLTFGKIAAMEKDEAHILIDTNAKVFLEQPSKSIFSNLQVVDNRGSFIVQVEKDYDMNMVYFNKFKDANEKEFYLYYGGRIPLVSNYVKGSMINISEVEKKIEFDLPIKSFTNPLRFDLDFYPSWIEEDVLVEIK